jgi:hypothetical protein
MPWITNTSQVSKNEQPLEILWVLMDKVRGPNDRVQRPQKGTKTSSELALKAGVTFAQFVMMTPFPER